MNDTRAPSGVRALFASASPRRQAQLRLVILLTLVGAVAELMTIGAIVPMLLVASDASRARSIPVLGQALDVIMSLTGANVIVAAAALLTIAALVATLLRLALNWVTQKFVYGFHRDLVLQIFGRSLRQPFSWYAQQNSSVLLSAVEKVYLITVGLIAPLVTALSSAVMVVIIGAFLVFINPVAALIAILVVGSVYAFMVVSTRRVSHRISETESRVRGVRTRALQESLGGIRDILLDQTQAVFEARLAVLETEHSQLLAQSNVISQAPRLVVEGAVIMLVAALALWFNAQPGGVMQALPVLGALALGSQRLLPMVQIVYYGYINYTFHRASLNDVIALLHLPVEPDGGPKLSGTDRFASAIEFQDVSFRYDGFDNAISDAGLVIRKGERIGIIGKTGSGKSTLIDLIMGLLRPSEGAILIDGVPLTAEKRSQVEGAGGARSADDLPGRRHDHRQHRVRLPRGGDRRRSRAPGGAPGRLGRLHRWSAAGFRDRRW